MKPIISITAVMLAMLFGTMTLQAQELSVLLEEDVYPVPSPDNGAGPTWCYGSTTLVRVGSEVFLTELAVESSAKPLNNCRWKLLKRYADPVLLRLRSRIPDVQEIITLPLSDDDKPALDSWFEAQNGWQSLFSDDANRTREPSPMAVFPDTGEIFVSANPTLVTDLEKYSGPARPEVVPFRITYKEIELTYGGLGRTSTGTARFPIGIEKQETLLPVWNGEPQFTEHSYRSFAADGVNRELILFQNIGYTHAEWAFYDRSGNWSATGQLAWPFGAEYAKPCPIRTCYPTVALVDRKAYFCGVSDIIEPNPEWAAYKKELTGRDWDYDFRRLFFTWTNDIGNEDFQPWVEVSSREKTCGWIMPNDLYVAPDESVHLLWSERAIDTRLREKFYPDEKQSEALCHAVIRDGKVVQRNEVMIRHENEAKPVASTGRFHTTPDGRLWVVYYVSGREIDATTGERKSVSENRIMEIKNGTPTGDFQTIPLTTPFSSFFTATVRAGNAPSAVLDLHGTCPNSNQLRYAAVNIK